jgi:hypothetical protein
MEFNVGDEVALLPYPLAAPQKTLAIAIVQHVGEVFIQLNDGHMYAAVGLRGLNTTGTIVPATDAHRSAIQRFQAMTN